jgi:hypothetical protein
MAVNKELLCSFELLKPLDSTALKNHIKKGRKERQSTLNSPVSVLAVRCISSTTNTACSLQINILRATRRSAHRRIRRKVKTSRPVRLRSPVRLKQGQHQSRPIRQNLHRQIYQNLDRYTKSTVD